MFCNKCGTNVNDGAKFCQSCGAPIGNGNSDSASTNSAANKAEEIKNDVLNPKDHTSEFDREDIEANKVICGISYLPILFFLPWLGCPNSRFGKFHANQALIAFIAYAILGVFSKIFSSVFGLLFSSLFANIWFLNGILWAVFSFLPGLLSLGIFLFGIINTMSGKAKELPLIGRFKIMNY